MIWQTKKLGDVCDLATGGTPSRAKPHYFDGDIKWLLSGDIHQGEIFDCEARITPEGMDNSNAKILPLNSVLIALNGQGKTRGTVALLRTKATCNQSLVSISPKVSSALLPEFLYLNLHGRYEEIRKMTGDTGNDRRGLNMLIIRNIKISVPPIPEQKRIVKTLDDVFKKLAEAKENAEKNLQNSKELFESYLNNVFANPAKDWEEKNLDEVCVISSKLIDPREKKYIDLIHVGAGNIETMSGHLIELKTAQIEKLISGKFLFNDKMVLYSKIRPYLMKVVRPDFDGLCSADIYPLLPREKILSRDFLYYLLLSCEFTKYAISGSGRAGMPKVNREHLFAFTFFLPPLLEQNEIVKKLDALSAETNKLGKIYKQKLTDLEELKKSVLSKAFTGEL